MKAKSIFAALLVCAQLFCGCSKDASDSITGSYTYKTSGTVTLMASQLAGLDAATLSAYRAAGINVDPVIVGLYPEQGQLHILDNGDGSVVLTFNDILGNADVTTGRITGESLAIDGGDIKAARLTDGNEKIGAGMVVFTGTGKKYDDMLLIDLEYKGEFTVNGINMTVIGSDVNCVAQANL